MHFQIYIPEATDVAASLDLAGLGHLAIDFDASLTRGPDGGRGALFRWLSPASREFGYRPDEQTWKPAAAGEDLEAGRYWVGLWNDQPPTPKQLARRYQQPGTSIDLGDGNAWLIPRATELPRDVQLADDGSLRFEVQRKFHEFYLQTEHWRAQLLNLDPDAPDDNPIAYADLWRFALAALVINYRITPEVVSALSLFSTSTLTAPLWAVLGAQNAIGGGR